MARRAEQLTLAKLKKYLIALQITWTAIILASCLRNLSFTREGVTLSATTEARTACDKDLLYRRWVAIHGGVYVTVDDKTPPNPYLKVPERDINTPSGRRLTLVNPAYMTRQVHELGREYAGVQGHITSLNPLNPGNAPDPWERKALEKIATGKNEVVELLGNDKPRLRYMRRLLTEKECLKCHAAQGYHVGDVRGGISVTVPLSENFALLRKAYIFIIGSHLFIWLIGFTALTLGGGRLKSRIEQKSSADLRAEMEWNAAMDASADAIYLLDMNRRIIRANKAFYAMTQSTPDSAIGSHIESVIHPEGEDFPCPVCRAQEEKRDFHLVMETDHPDNPAPFPIEITLKVVRDEDDNPVSMLMFIHDLSNSRREIEEKKRLEADLQQARKMEAIGTLAGGIAHDFNNILTAIIGYTEMARLDINRGEDLVSDLEEVLKAGYRARDLVRQILSFSRHAEHERKPLKIQYELKEALKLMRASIPTTIEIKEDIDTDCETVLADPSDIYQIIMNLCTNAYQAMREEGGTISISLKEIDRDDAGTTSIQTDRYVRLTVSDTGPGIKEESLDRIFEPYFTTKGQGEGTGLGLAVVQGVIKRCGGEISVQSRPGHGATFTIYLPVNQGEHRNEVETGARPVDGNGEMIMVVDDDQAIADLERQILEGLNYRVTMFTDSAAALAAFRQDPDAFALVLSDMTMPQMTGRELAREILALRPRIPVIIATGYSDLIDHDTAHEIGISSLIGKPISRAELASRINCALTAAA